MKMIATGPARPWWVIVLFSALLLPAVAGAFFSLIGVLMAIMGSDSPRNSAVLSNLIMIAAAIIAAGTVTLVLRGMRLMSRGEAKAACFYLLPPAVEAAAYLTWLRS